MKTVWTKFYNSETKEVITYYNDQKTLQHDGETFDFATPEETVVKSTAEVFIFWDDVAIGTGALHA